MPYGTMATDRLMGINYGRMREYRLARAKEMLKNYNIGTLMTWDAVNMRYLTSGYPSVPCRWASSMISVLCRGGEPLLSATTSFDPEDMKNHMPWLLRDHVTKDIGGGKLAFNEDSWKSFMDYMCKFMEDNGVLGQTVALDLCPVPQLVKKLFNKKGIDVIIPMDAIYEMRSIKNSDEIACMRISAAIAEAAMHDMKLAIRPSARESDLVSLGVKREYVMGSDEVVPPGVASGPRANPMHSDFTDRILVAGDMVNIAVDSATYCAYKTSLGRTFVVGKATQQQKDTYAVALGMIKDALSVIKRGANTNDILNKWPKTASFWGYDNLDECRYYAHGHGIGLCFDEAPYFSCADGVDGPGNELKEGMVLALEVWYGRRGDAFGASIKETVRVTGSGYELITKYPVDRLIECPLV